MRHRSCGFTLIEVMAVIVIMGILAAAAALTFARPLAASRAQSALEQIRSLDASTRAFATRFARPAEIAFDLSNNTIARRDRDQIVFQFPLPANVRAAEVRVGDHSETLGEVAVPISASGMSRSYAVRLVGRDLDLWLVFAGLSGQVTQVNDVATLDQILPAGAARDDAD